MDNRPKRHPDARGKVITFYSYKGGVGRSFILANVAAQLALWNYRVLCLDWDLEAPGLLDYFRDDLPRDAEQNTDGVVDLLLKYQNANDSAADWRSCILDVPLRHRTNSKLTGNLHLIQAGRRAPQSEYIANVRKLDWNVLYGEKDFANKLDDLKREWQEDYDFILVDSRTGISDISGVCTVQLPDVLALVLTANQQSLDGIFEVANRAVEKHSSFPLSEGKLLTVPILSRLDQQDETTLSESWIARIGKKLAPLFHSWLDRKVSVSRMMDFCKVPYISRWSFGESIAVLLERGTDTQQVSHSLKSISGLLLGGLDESARFVENRDSFLRSVAGEEVEDGNLVFTNPTAQTIFESNSAATMSSYAVELHRSGKNLDDAESLYQKAIELNPKDANTLGNFALFLETVRKEYDRAEKFYERAVLADPRHAANIGNFAVYLQTLRKDYDRAEELYERAIKADPNDAANLGNFARFLSEQRKEYDRAEELYERAIEADPNDADHLGNFAVFLTSERKEYDRAEELYVRAIEADPNDAIHLGNFAGMLMAQGKVKYGFELLERSRHQASTCHDPNALFVELLFYEVAYGDHVKRSEAFKELLERLKNGERSVFSLERHIEEAQKTDPDHAEFLKELAAVINDKEPISILDEFMDSSRLI